MQAYTAIAYDQVTGENTQAVTTRSLRDTAGRMATWLIDNTRAERLSLGLELVKAICAYSDYDEEELSKNQI